MYNDPTDDWFDWRMSHPMRHETGASLITIAVTLAGLLLIPLMF